MYIKRVSLIFLLFIMSACNPQNKFLKAAINFNISYPGFSDLKLYLEELALEERMIFTDSSYKYGTTESPEYKLVVHLKGKTNLEIFVNCYSDWQECSVEFLCYKQCVGWEKNFSTFKKSISQNWQIINSFNINEA